MDYSTICIKYLPYLLSILPSFIGLKMRYKPRLVILRFKWIDCVFSISHLQSKILLFDLIRSSIIRIWFANRTKTKVVENTLLLWFKDSSWFLPNRLNYRGSQFCFVKKFWHLFLPFRMQGWFIAQLPHTVPLKMILVIFAPLTSVMKMNYSGMARRLEIKVFICYNFLYSSIYLFLYWVFF